MPKPSIGRMTLALPLMFGIAPAFGGYQLVGEWAAEGTALLVSGAVLLLSGATMLLSAVWLLVSLAGCGKTMVRLKMLSRFRDFCD
jgi:hypothetical protein